jgi:serine/threonine protein kinase
MTIVELVKGMKFIHSQNLIHGDLKPTNILIDDDHNIKISDFGTSRVFERDVTMMNAGTPLYMSPETADGHYDNKIDVYSFGIVVYEIVTGNGLFSDEGNKTRLYLDMQNGKRPDIPKEVLPFTRELISKCWSQESSKRPSFNEIWTLLKKQEFKIINGVDIVEVIAEVSRIETRERSLGIEID